MSFLCTVGRLKGISFFFLSMAWKGAKDFATSVKAAEISDKIKAAAHNNS